MFELTEPIEAKIRLRYHVVTTKHLVVTKDALGRAGLTQLIAGRDLDICCTFTVEPSGEIIQWDLMRVTTGLLTHPDITRVGINYWCT